MLRSDVAITDTLIVIVINTYIFIYSSPSSGKVVIRDLGPVKIQTVIHGTMLFVTKVMLKRHRLTKL